MKYPNMLILPLILLLGGEVAKAVAIRRQSDPFESMECLGGAHDYQTLDMTFTLSTIPFTPDDLPMNVTITPQYSNRGASLSLNPEDPVAEFALINGKILEYINVYDYDICSFVDFEEHDVDDTIEILCRFHPSFLFPSARLLWDLTWVARWECPDGEEEGVMTLKALNMTSWVERPFQLTGDYGDEISYPKEFIGLNVTLKITEARNSWHVPSF